MTLAEYRRTFPKQHAQLIRADKMLTVLLLAAAATATGGTRGRPPPVPSASATPSKPPPSTVYLVASLKLPSTMAMHIGPYNLRPELHLRGAQIQGRECPQVSR